MAVRGSAPRRMRWRRGWSRGLAATCLATALSLLVSACTGGGGDRTVHPSAPSGRHVAPVDGAGAVPDAASIKGAGKGLPADPAQAASVLVDRMFGDDARAAVAATGELLRRAGLPLGSGAGPMVALPSTYTITNAQVGVELLPSLTEQARAGIGFDMTQVRAVLGRLGLPTAAPTDAQLIAGLAEWGKRAGDPVETQYAGAALRALAAEHGQVFAAGDLPTAAQLAALRSKPESLTLDEYQRLVSHPVEISLDPVQLLLLAAHLAGSAATKTVVKQRQVQATPGGAHSVTGRRFVTCQDVEAALDTKAGAKAQEKVKKTLQDALKEDVAERIGKAAAQNIEKAFEGYDKLADVLSYLAFTAALRFDVGPVDKSTTHFLHKESAHANDVKFRAHAYFKEIVPPEYRGCFILAGIGIPRNKDLKDMQIIWSLPNGRVGLKPAVVGERQFDYPITLDGHGESTVQTTPRRESNPPPDDSDRPQSTVVQQVKAALDKNYLELHITDLIPLLFGNVPAAAVSIAYKVVVALIKEAGLPERTLDFPVTYHGSDVYRILGDGDLAVPMYVDVPLAADLYSCDGPDGPWQGTISIIGDAGPLLEQVGVLFGKNLSGRGGVVLNGKFQLNTRSAAAQTFAFNDKFGVVVQLDQSAIDTRFRVPSGTNTVGERLRVIGSASWAFNGVDARQAASILGELFSSGLDIPVEAVPGDLRCKGTAIYQNEFD